MGRILVVLLCAVALLPSTVRAAGTPGLTVKMQHSSVRAGQQETVSISANDLSGKPVANARVSVSLTYSSDPGSHLLLAARRTDRQGQASMSILVPRNAASSSATVAVTVTAGYLRETASAAFRVTATASLPGTRPTSGKTPLPHHPPTATPGTSGSLEVSARVLPVAAVIPQPVWVVVVIRSAAGKLQPRAAVSARVGFSEGAVVIHGVADSAGIATLLIDTSRARHSQRVGLRVNAWSGKAYGARLMSFNVDLKAAPTATPTGTPTSTSTATATATPTATDLPTVTNTPLPTAVPTATPTSPPAATATPAATSTPVPTSTATPTATDSPTPSPTPFPTSTSTPVPNCPGSASGCMQAALNMINSTRAQYGVQPLSLNMAQSAGTSSCVGSYGHSTAMASSGQIWHQNAAYPAASFPTDICVSHSWAGENVGQWGGSDELTEITGIFQAMMSEQHDTAYCSVYDNHACNILNSRFSQIGIGLFYSGGVTWYTTDFIG